MKLLGWVGLLGICAAAAALAQPGQAAAGAGAGAASSGPAALIPLEASEGYRAILVTGGNQVLLEARRKRVAAAYLVRGRVSAERIYARFGDLGLIDVEFHPFGGRDEERGGCRRSPLQVGIYRGTIEFRGEDGYTKVDTRRTVGLVHNPRPKRCQRRSRADRSAAPGSDLDTHLTAISKRGETVTSFDLSRRRGRQWLSLEATRQERRATMLIFRQSSTVVGGENAFAASGPGVRPPFAFVAAPKPFSGSAVFDGSAAPGAQWIGSLAAWMPGAGKVGLAGPDYALSFCRRTADEPGCNPEPPVRSPFSALQGSGSQSQLLADARLSWSRYLRNSASSAGSTP